MKPGLCCNLPQWRVFIHEHLHGLLVVRVNDDLGVTHNMAFISTCRSQCRPLLIGVSILGVRP